MSEALLWPRWHSFWHELGWIEQVQTGYGEHGQGEIGCGEAFAQMATLYSEPHRAYHTLEHIAACLKVFDQVKAIAHKPAAIEAAIWFHDVIYQIGAADNELQSAEWALACLEPVIASTQTVINNEFGRQVYQLIICTDHKSTPTDGDQQLLTDIDLSGLGTSPEAYARYSEQIRFEYQEIPWEQYAQGRSILLKQFLERATIYATPQFQERFEEQARCNINAEIEQLRSSLSPNE